MDQSGGGGASMADMNSMFGGMTQEDLQMGMDGLMNMDMKMDMAMSPEYAAMMDPSSDRSQGHHRQNGHAKNAQMGAGMNHMLMPGFAGGPPNDLDGYQFDPNTTLPPGMSPNFVSSPAISAGTPNSLPNGGGIAKRRLDKQRAHQQRRASSSNIALNTDFHNLNSGMVSASQSPIHPMTAIGVPMSMDTSYGFGMGMPLDMGVNVNMGHHGDVNSYQNLYSNQSMNQQMMNQQMMPPQPSRRQSFPAGMTSMQHRTPSDATPKSTPGTGAGGGSGANANGIGNGANGGSNGNGGPGGNGNGNGHGNGNGNDRMGGSSSGNNNNNNVSDEQMVMQKMPQMNMSEAYNQAQILTQQYHQAMNELNNAMSPRHPSFSHSQPPLDSNSSFYGYDTIQQRNANSFSTADTNVRGGPGGPPGGAGSGQNSIPQYLNAYSATGFDMLTVLMKVATRPKPRINIGSVDMSCAFVVCDVNQHDVPIVYCSEMFERLTGYTRHEILGRNCRFLQAPDGRVESGIKRKYVDDRAVLHLKNMINQRQEAQISLINYRKGGQPFMNLLTMIPISWDTDEIKYYVGFQVDLVEQPGAVTNKNPDGSYQINYQRTTDDAYRVPSTPHPGGDAAAAAAEPDRSIGSDEVSTVLANIGQNESEISKRIWDKVLLENTDDVVHVLSLKGLFLYLSPSCKRILEYDPQELVGTALSSVCHPSDIVPVTRELKDTSSGSDVNVVFRIRRKHSGYTWFEAHGTLHLEQGKAKKCIILVGRERPVYALLRNEVISGFGEQELWTKMSTTGMFLYVSHNVKQLLDRLPEDLVGTSAQNLMRQESKVSFGQALEIVRTGSRFTFKHDVQNRRGQTLHAETTLYPGDAAEGRKPTFLVAQTRLIKMSRGQPALLKQTSSTSERSQGFFNSVESYSQSPNTASTGGVSGGQHGSRPTPMSLMSADHNGNANPNPNNANGGGGTGGPGGNGGHGRTGATVTTAPGGHGLALGNQDEALAADDNVFDELKTTRSTSWQFELRQMEKKNRLLAEELQSLLSSKKKRKRRKGLGQLQKDCANCHTRNTPEWRRGPSGQRDLCNSCGLRWAKQQGRVSPRTSSQHSGDKRSTASSPRHGGDDKAMHVGSQGSPASHQSPANAGAMPAGSADRAAKTELSGGHGVTGPAAVGERTVPQTIQEGVEPADEDL